MHCTTTTSTTACALIDFRSKFQKQRNSEPAQRTDFYNYPAGSQSTESRDAGFACRSWEPAEREVGEPASQLIGVVATTVRVMSADRAAW